MEMKIQNSKNEIKREIELPEGVEAKVEADGILIKGRLGELKRDFLNKNIFYQCTGKNIVISARDSSKNEKKMLGTIEAHLRNMISGVQNMHKYVLRICSGHFPMQVSVSGGELIIKNLLGEKTPRKIPINKNVKIKFEGRDLTVESTNKELAGETASRIEKLSMRGGYDRRIFQDGIFIVNKDGKPVK